MNAVDVEKQYTWEIYDNQQSYHPVDQFDPFLSEKHWQQFEQDLIHSRLVTIPNQKVVFRCMMPDNSQFDNQVVWKLEIEVSGKSNRGESMTLISGVGYRDVRLVFGKRSGWDARSCKLYI